MNGQADTYIELQNQRLNITPTEFYISRIDDERIDKNTIGKLIPVTSPANPAGAIRIDLKGGAATSLHNFVSNSFTANKLARPLIIKIKSFSVIETAATAGKVEGKISLSIEFGFERDEDFIPLSSYSGGSTYQRNIGPAQQIEPLIRAAIVNTILHMNNWMDKQADTNIKLARSVKVKFTDYDEQPEGDTIYYNVNRPLTWADFMAKPQNSRYAAEIFASLGYGEGVKLVKGIIYITLDIKVYVPKSASWVRFDAMNSNSLNHEQRHFDIVKLVAERFKQKVLAENLSTHNYDGPINMAYLDALREIYAMQKQYDGDTGHGTNAYRQQEWCSRIDKELQSLGIKLDNDQAAFN
nr:hypothetical protein [uncultured Mucilaginibacter sp.]